LISLVVIVGLLLTVLTGIPVARQVSKHHPRGLFVLFFTELWERFSFYGMRTLLILYLTQHFLFDDAFAAQTFGAFTTLAYMLPLLGGYLADRYLGARRAVAFGAVLLVAGHLVMAIEGPPAQQMLEVGGQRLEVRSMETAGERHLSVRVERQDYPLRSAGNGDLVIDGLQDHAELGGGALAKDRYRLSVAHRDPLYVGLLFTALSLIALGVGFLKGNVSTLVGALYPAGDTRREAGFTLYYFGINLGSFWAAVLCGYLGLRYGWNWGFGLAAAGMAAGLIAFVFGRRHLQGEGEAPVAARIDEQLGAGLRRKHVVYGASLLVVPIVAALMQRNEIVGGVLLFASLGSVAYVLYVMFTRHSNAERLRMFLALALVGGSVIFWTLFLQGGTSLNLFADRNTDLTILHSPLSFGFSGREVFVGTSAMLDAAGGAAGRIWIDSELTSAQVQSFNVAFVLVFAPVFAALWSWLRRRGLDVSSVTKFSLGLVQVGLGFLVIVWSQQFADSAFRLPLLVLGVTYLLHTTGELFVSPVGLSELTRLSPPTLVSTMMAIWLLSSSAAQFVGSVIASFAATATVGGQVLDPEQALRSSLTVFNWVGWIGVGAGVLFLALAPLARAVSRTDAHR